MPYRRLPNTDISRIKALKTAIEKSANLDYNDVALEMKTLSEAKRIVSKFERLTLKYQQTFDIQVRTNITFQDKVRNARLYISHFIQVLYMCVQRSEIKKNQLEYYNLHNLNMLQPELNSNEQILEWGNNIINGEGNRIRQGGVPLYNPSIAKVNVMFSLFKDGYQTQKIHQNATNKIQEEVSEFRSEVDIVIAKIWDEVEKYNSKYESQEKIEKNKEYGLIYYYRKSNAVRDDNN